MLQTIIIEGKGRKKGRIVPAKKGASIYSGDTSAKVAPVRPTQKFVLFLGWVCQEKRVWQHRVAIADKKNSSA